MELIILPNYDAVSKWTANYIRTKINTHEAGNNTPFVLGLPTGSSPVGTYKELIQSYEKKEVTFKNVITFNMDEYVGIAQNHPQSYHTFMWDNFFSHIDINHNNINLLSGMATDLDAECKNYENKIKNAGGIDLFFGGIGNDGHIAFNEPGSSLVSKTRVKTLRHDTIEANSRFFNNDVNAVPKQALTVGVQTIMDASEVLIIVNGHGKARALRNAIEGGINHMWPISILQMHPKGIIVCDESAASELSVDTYKYFKELNINTNKVDHNKLGK